MKKMKFLLCASMVISVSFVLAMEQDRESKDLSPNENYTLTIIPHEIPHLYAKIAKIIANDECNKYNEQFKIAQNTLPTEKAAKLHKAYLNFEEKLEILPINIRILIRSILITEFDKEDIFLQELMYLHLELNKSFQAIDFFNCNFNINTKIRIIYTIVNQFTEAIKKEDDASKKMHSNLISLIILLVKNLDITTQN